MSWLENVWSLGLLAILGIALLIFRRIRRRTADFHQSKRYKANLPQWVAQFETFTLVSLIVVWVIAIAFVFFRVALPSLNVTPSKTGASAVYSATGMVMIAIPIAALCANLVSWATPPIRRANLEAMEGLQVSFWSANRGLLLFGAVTVPTGLVLLAICLIAPWRT